MGIWTTCLCPPQTNRMRWRFHHRHPRREKKRSSRSSSWWRRSVGSRRSPMGHRCPAAASRASASRPIKRSFCQRSWRIWTSGGWTYSLFQSTPTTDLLPASCTPSSRYGVFYPYQYHVTQCRENLLGLHLHRYIHFNLVWINSTKPS